MIPRDIVVVGASAGGIEVIAAILRDLPADFPASMFIVVHIAPQSPGYLAEIFDRAGPLPVANARNGEVFARGRVYLAPPDRHLVLEATGHTRVARGPRVNRARPAVDPLFQSAARAFGQRVIGVVLSGGLDDGSAGLRSIKMCGGTTVVQEPLDATVTSMPMHALRSSAVDHCRPAARLGPLINRLVRARAPDRPTRLGAATRELASERKTPE
jgi:two-component system, chemotaxis family, protein-glutamate methylesterase/glutaminase